MTPTEILSAGAQILAPVLGPLGFRYVPGAVDVGSGGAFAQGAFATSDRQIEFSVRGSLGLVTYSASGCHTTHEHVMRVLAPRGSAEYPGFSKDPVDGFHHLAADIRRFGLVFLQLPLPDFQALCAKAEAEAPRGWAALEDCAPAR
jgi:hypothetical protein